MTWLYVPTLLRVVETNLELKMNDGTPLHTSSTSSPLDTI